MTANARLGALLFITLGLALAGGCGKHPGMEPGEPDATVPWDGAAVGPPQWAMHGANAQRTARSAFTGPTQGTVEQVDLSRLVPGYTFEQVIVESIDHGGTVYLLLRDEGSAGHVVAYDPDVGVRWRYPLQSPSVIGGCAINDAGELFVSGMFYVQGTDPLAPWADYLLRLTRMGGVQWQWGPAAPLPYIISDPHHGLVVDGQGRSYAILPYRDDPTGDEDYQFNRYLASVNADGTLRWTWSQDVGLARVAPALASDGSLRVLVGEVRLVPDQPLDPEDHEGLYKVRPDGTVAWQVPSGEAWLDAVAVRDDDVTLFARDPPALVAVDPDGTVRWTWEPADWAEGAVRTAIAVGPDGTAYLGGWNDATEPWEPGVTGRLVAVGPDGTLALTFPTVGHPSGYPVVDAAGAVYFLVQDPNPEEDRNEDPGSRLIALEPDGTLRFEVALPGLWCDTRILGYIASGNIHATMALGQGGRLYLGSDTGVLTIVR